MRLPSMLILTAAMLMAALPMHVAQEAPPKPVEKPVEKPPAKPANPLEPLAKAIGGVWIEESEINEPDGNYTKTASEWGVNQKCILSKVWSVTGDTETLVMEGGLYWHPGRKEVVTWAVLNEGPVMEGTVTIEGSTQKTVWTMTTGPLTVSGENHARYVDADTLETDELYKVGEEMRKLRTRRMVRKEAGWKPAKDEDSDGQPNAEKEKPAEKPVEEKPSSLKASGKQVGGIWVTEAGAKDPTGPYNYFKVEWGAGNKLLRSTTWQVKDGKATQLYGGAQYWHPGRKELVFHEISRTGEVYIGTIIERDGAQVSRWTAFTDKGESEFEQRVNFEDDDTILSGVLVKKDGELHPMMEFKFVRKPDGWRETKAPAPPDKD